jgi:hypothetical protein
VPADDTDDNRHEHADNIANDNSNVNRYHVGVDNRYRIQKTEGAVTSVTPAYGQYNTRVTIAGSNLRGHGFQVATVRLAGVLSDIVTETGGTVVVIADASVAKTGPIILTATSGAIVSSGEFEYRTQGEVDTLSPASGQYGTEVTIAGSNLLAHGDALASVTLGGVEVKKIVSETADSVEVVVDHGPSVETIGDVVITADSGAEITASSGWKYLQPGRISTVNPEQGRVNSKITIFGRDLCGGGS